jgi:long-chain fatty acid transport protein
MKRLWVSGMLMLMVSSSTFAGGLLTNTNQHVSFLRMIARGASTDIDAVYSNPAGVGFMADGTYIAVNWQSAYQTRVINADFSTYYNDGGVPTFRKVTHKYKGTASAPVIPSIQAVYKVGDWAFSGSFAITGGGGKASFDEGLPMFDSMVMAGIYNATQGAVNPDMYTINSAMDGKQYIYGLQLGLSYKVNDYLSVFGGGRMNYVNSGYEGYLYANSKAEGGATLAKIELDCDQTGWGLTPIIGLDFKYGKWNVGVKYEFMANLNIENKTKKNSDPDKALAAYKDGVNTPNDLPAMLMAAVGYEFLPNLRATAEYHQFFDKDAGMADNKQKKLTGNTHEYLLGVEWDINKYLTVSGGCQKTDYGLSDGFQSDTSFSCDSYSVGLGAAIKFSPKVTLNVGYFWTDYKDYIKDVKATGTPGTGYYGTGLAGENVYSRTNKVFGVGLDYKF